MAGCVVDGLRLGESSGSRLGEIWSPIKTPGPARRVPRVFAHEFRWLAGPIR